MAGLPGPEQAPPGEQRSPAGLAEGLRGGGRGEEEHTPAENEKRSEERTG